ncbi:DUF2000 domain-containing protein [Nonomuraea longicatena]|uniref:DUF2000 domain-containing protein n=1 Tax=Nonomuraea longicatena TaxID=83682 RepID=A0ABP4AJH9_9ACTN
MNTKLVMVLRDDLPRGLAVNAAAVLALSLGGRLDGWLGADGKDASGGVHAGLNTHPVPVVTATGRELRELRERAADRSELRVVAFNEVARRSRDYDDYLAALEATPGEEIGYVGALVFGPRGPVTKLTKRFPLMR